MLAVACLGLARQLALSWDSPSYSVCGAGFFGLQCRGGLPLYTKCVASLLWSFWSMGLTGFILNDRVEGKGSILIIHF